MSPVWTKDQLDSVSETLLRLQQAVADVDFDEYDIIDPLEYPERF